MLETQFFEQLQRKAATDGRIEFADKAQHTIAPVVKQQESV